VVEKNSGDVGIPNPINGKTRAARAATPTQCGSISIRLEQLDMVAWITLNRPEFLNSIDPDMLRQFDATLDALEADSSVRVVVVTGAGRAFCAGADLKAVARLDDAAERARVTSEFLHTATSLLRRIETSPKPIIAAVNGLALAGGLELVLCCDLVIAAECATFGDAHAKLGLVPGWGGSVRLPRKVGENRARELMLTGESRPAALMKEWGLVNEVVPLIELVTATGALAAQLATRSPLGLQRMKHLVRDGLDQPLEIALRAEKVMCEAHNSSHDRAEGIRAFVEKRTPRFIGS
jgi:enoyl-CoA hydratase